MDANIKQIRERWAKAEPGPWCLGGCSGRMITTPSGYAGDGFIADVDIKANAEAIANAPTDIAYLLDKVAELEAGAAAMLQIIHGKKQPCSLCEYGPTGGWDCKSPDKISIMFCGPNNIYRFFKPSTTAGRDLLGRLDRAERVAKAAYAKEQIEQQVDGGVIPFENAREHLIPIEDELYTALSAYKEAR